jgi:NCS1 family nucleobase:cation symporter-1
LILCLIGNNDEEKIEPNGNMTIEKIGIEHVPEELRHGKPSQLFTLWLASNLTIADYAVGFLPVRLGVPLPSIIIAILRR